MKVGAAAGEEEAKMQLLTPEPPKIRE